MRVVKLICFLSLCNIGFSQQNYTLYESSGITINAEIKKDKCCHPDYIYWALNQNKEYQLLLKNTEMALTDYRDYARISAGDDPNILGLLPAPNNDAGIAVDPIGALWLYVNTNAPGSKWVKQAVGQRPWIKQGNTTETSATDVLKTDAIYHSANVGINNIAPQAPLHVGSLAPTSTKPGILLATTVNTPNVAEHGIVNNSILTNGESYAAFDANYTVNENINTDITDHVVSYQSLLNIAATKTVEETYGFYDRLSGTGTVKLSRGGYFISPSLGVNVDSYAGVQVSGSGSAVTNLQSSGYLVNGLNSTIKTVGFSTSNLVGTTEVTGLEIVNLTGGKIRPIFTRVENNVFAPNEFYYQNTGNKDMLMLSRASVNDGEQLSILWEAGSGATKYYSGRFGSSYNNSLQGDFIFQTNATGASGLAALTEKARIRYDGSLIHQGFHQYTSAFAPSGAGVPNGSTFKGTDGALYYKGGAGTITLIGAN